MNKSDLLRLDSAIELQAAKAKPKKLRITAYDGQIMSVSGWGPVIINLAGLDFTRAITILDAHKQDVQSILGAGKAAIEDGRLVVTATLANTQAAATVLELLEAGVALQSSVGVRPSQVSSLRPGAKVKVNGKTIEVDRHVEFIEAGILEEVSVLAVGAANQTEVRIAARRAAQLGGTNMEPNNQTEVIDPVAQERQRVIEVNDALSDYPDLRASAIRDNWTADRARSEALNRLRASRPQAPSVMNGGGSMPSEVSNRSIIASAVLLRAGRSDVATKHFGERAVQAAHDLRAHSLYDICRASLRLSQHEAWNSGDRDEVIKAGFSTQSLPVGLGDAVNKMALQQYLGYPASWRAFCKIANLNDFRTHKQIRPAYNNSSMPLLPHGGEIKHTNVTEEVFSVSAETYAEMMSVDRRDIINDDVSLFTQYADALARKAASTVSDLVWTAILGNAGTHFGSGNANQVVNVIGIDGLSAAITKMRKQADASGKPIDIVPTSLIVPPELEGAARQSLRSTSQEVRSVVDDDSVLGVGIGNPLPDLQLGVEPRISSAAFTGYSATSWYLFAAPSDSPIILGFLGGREAPTVETVDPPSNVLGMTMRGYIDAGVALGDKRAAVKSTGAGA